jgi:hypothetical protein
VFTTTVVASPSAAVAVDEADERETPNTVQPLRTVRRIVRTVATKKVPMKVLLL